jgi:hypothetical protein
MASAAGQKTTGLAPGQLSGSESPREPARGLHTVAQAMQSQIQVLEPRLQEQNRPEQSELAKIAQARIKGYEGDPCASCGSFTLVRNGTCMKCHTCGGTTGCS